VTGRQPRRRKQLLDAIKKMIGYSKLKQEALDRRLCVVLALEKAMGCRTTECGILTIKIIIYEDTVVSQVIIIYEDTVVSQVIIAQSDFVIAFKILFYRITQVNKTA